MEINCPACGESFVLNDYTYRRFTGEVKCVSCRSTLELESSSYEEDGYGVAAHVLSLRLKEQVKVFLPGTAPREVADDLAEAARCFNAKAYKATVTMCRRSLETASDSKGAKGKNLSEKIVDLHTNGIIDEPTYHLASGIRQFGNFGAHPKEDLLKTVGEQEAEFILRITERVLKQLSAQKGKK